MTYTPPSNDDADITEGETIILRGGVDDTSVTETDSDTEEDSQRQAPTPVVPDPPAQTPYESFLDNNSNLALVFRDGEPLDAIAESISSSIKDFTEQVDAEYAQQFIDTASGEGLDQIGELVDVQRRGGEGDESFRVRIRAAFGQATSDTTINDLAVITRILTGATREELTIQPPSSPLLRVTIELGSQRIKDSPFSAQQLSEFLTDTVAASHEVEIRSSGTFVFDGPGFTPPPNSGFGEGTFGVSK